MRQYFIAGNWKMNKTNTEAAAFVKDLHAALGSCKHRVAVAPSFVALDAVKKALGSSQIQVLAQNMSAEESGAHTGEVSVLMLKDIGVNCVILGHSERRTIYGESDEFINKKVKLALKHGLEVILCVGETLPERESGKAEQVTLQQLNGGLSGVSADELKKVTIAYEPVWAIGTGKTASPQDANAMHKVIRSEIAKKYSAAAAENLIIQYGGSVKPDNAKELMGMPDIDGALVGGASLKVQDFTAIAQFDK